MQAHEQGRSSRQATLAGPHPGAAGVAHRASTVPEVSVVIPTLNRWPTLSASALPSALGQDGVDHEVIVVDDGSTDETPARLAELAHPRLRVLRHESNRGVSRARNTGIEAARGAWLAFLDDDDLWSPDKLRRQVDAAHARGASFAYSSAIVLSDDRRPVLVDSAPHPDQLAALILERNVIPGGCSNAIARTDLVRRLGGFDEELSVFADWDLWIRLALAGPAASCPDVLVGYRQHRGNMVIVARPDVLGELRYLARKHRSAASGVSIDGLWAARWAAGSNRWAGRRFRAAALYLRAGIAYRSQRDVRRAAFVLARALIPHPAVAHLLFRALTFAKRLARRDPDATPELAVPEPWWLAIYHDAPAHPR